MLLYFALCLLGYLLGSLSSAIIVCKLAGLPDPRTEGSGNPGATNVLRIGGKKTAAMVLAGDVLKGVIPVVIAKLLDADDTLLAAVAFSVFLGHLFPVFFGFHGGKGVATAIGAIFALSWQLGLILVMIWIAMSYMFKISSLAALVAATAAPIIGFWLFDKSIALTVSLSAISLILLWRHRSNISNILQGTEPKIGTKKKA